MRLASRNGLAVAALAAGWLAVIAGAVHGSVGASRVQPPLQTPIYGGIPGALPPGFHYVYGTHITGWPVHPSNVQHPIRGAFLDPRGPDDDALSGYHFGIDVNVDDRHRDPGAPTGLSHRVYALESGIVSEPVNDPLRVCGNRRLDVGHFAYWHVSPIVHLGQRVRAGQQIGWTCYHEWHVHVSEWQVFRGVRVWVDPLHKGSPIGPYVDTAPPVVAELRLFSPPVLPWHPTKSLSQPDSARLLAPTALRGPVELRARIGDPQSFLGFLADNPAWPTQFTPYRVAVEIREARTGRVVMSRVSFQADQLPQTPYLVHYAPWTVESDNMMECVGPPALKSCDGTYWFRPFSRLREEYWNTRAVPNGPYRITVRAWDIAGNVGSKSIDATVAN